MLRRNFILIILLWEFCCSFAFALQTKWVHENSTAWATISTQGLTRIAVDQDRIINVRGPSRAYTINNDNVQGSIFIKPLPEQQKPFTLFIATERNHNYLLHLVPKNQTADTILLRPTDTINLIADRWEKTTAYADAVSELMNDMANDFSPEGYQRSLIKGIKAKYLGKIATFTLKEIYEGSHLRGEIYFVQNRTRQTIALTESEFYQVGDRAIALKDLLISPKGATLLYKVVSHG